MPNPELPEILRQYDSTYCNAKLITNNTTNQLSLYSRLFSAKLTPIIKNTIHKGKNPAYKIKGNSTPLINLSHVIKTMLIKDRPIEIRFLHRGG